MKSMLFVHPFKYFIKCFLLTVVYLVISCNSSSAQYYMAKSSGNWSLPSIWFTSAIGGSDPANYITAASVSPTATNSVGIIVNANVVLDAYMTIDQTSINSGKTLTINSGQVLTIADGSGDDLIVTGAIINNGSINISSSSKVVYNGGDQTILALDYSELSFSGSISGCTKTFADGVTKVSSEIVIETDMTICGSSRDQAIVQVISPGVTLSRVFKTSVDDKTVNINDLTIKGGDISTIVDPVSSYGGGVTNYGGVLALNNVLISGSIAKRGGGVYNLGSRIYFNNSIIKDCRSTDSGGGFYGGFDILIENTTFESNYAAYIGGAIANPGDCKIINSTLSNNTAGYSCGAFRTWNSMTVINSTISGNHAETVDGTAGIDAAASFSITNSVVAYNTNLSGYKDFYRGTLLYGNNNIIGSSMSWAPGSSNNITYNYTSGKGDPLFSSYNEILVNTQYHPILDNNGGYTKTVALADNSIAMGVGVRTGSYMDAGNKKYAFWNGSNWAKVEDGTAVALTVTEITTDQRGVTRHLGLNSVGAYEKSIYSNFWTAATNSDWNTATNWDDNSVPVESDDVIIINTGTNPVISPTTMANCNNLNITTSANLIINSDATHSGSLIVSGTSSGDVTYNRYLTGSPTKWHLIGAPVVGQGINDLVTDVANSIATNGDKYGLGIYDEVNNNWITYNTTTAPGAGNLTPGMGYEILRTTDGVVSFTGELNTSQVNISITKTGRGWNSIGNPFSSAVCLNSNADGVNNFITVNSVILNDAYEAVYIWNASTSFYDIINQSSAALYLPPGQGFVMKAEAAGTVSHTKAMCSHQTDATFKNAESSMPEITLKAVSGELISTTKIRYIEGASLGLDPGYDAGVFDGASSDLLLSSRLLEEHSVKFGIQCLPNGNYENMNIPIEIQSSKNTEIVFSANILNFPTDINVYLEDCLKNIFTLLNENESYTTTITEGNSGNRFIIHTSQQLLGIDDILTNVDKFNIIPDYTNSSIRIIGELVENTEVSLIDLAGRVLFRTTLNGSDVLKVPNLKTGIYIVKLVNSEVNKSVKVYWR